MPSSSGALRSLPSVDRLLRDDGAAALLERYPRESVTEALRAALEDARERLRNGRAGRTPTVADLLERGALRLHALDAPSLVPVINATGVVLHTNLGRAPLAEEARVALERAAAGATNLELDLRSGKRGDRDAHVVEHLRALTGAEEATVVNNNAAAVLLALNTLAEGREVVVSRGELIEIGGSFRIPEILAKSGAVLREVGTTNRTHRRDYERAIGERTALLLKVHPSNYRIEGFTAEVSLGELVELGASRGVPVMEDLGSGALVDLSAYGLRCDKLTIAALEATLRLHRTEPDLARRLPVLRALARPLAEIEKVGAAVLVLLRERLGGGYEIELRDSEAEIGSGALPTDTIPSKAVTVRSGRVPPGEVAARFRRASPPILGRVRDDRFWLDLRCVWKAEDVVPDPP
jgi:L-seryl-tRNA(Ser) seleniumtransferase